MQKAKLNEIYLSQVENIKDTDDGVFRLALNFLPDIKNHALVISGVRRCGKSTLLRQFIKKTGRPFFYLNFDDLRLLEFSVSDYGILDEIIDETGIKFIFFDEIQTAVNWELYVRQKLDQGFKVVLTGSNASLLSRELGTKLTGRHIVKELFPFSYSEYLTFSKAKRGYNSFKKYFQTGGFPEYLKDVAGVKSHTTILEYFSYFENSYLLSLVQKFAWSQKAQSLAPKKVYFTDIGFIRTAGFAFSENAGHILENFVFNELRRKYGSFDDKQIYYYAEGNCECDFVVSPLFAPQCIQVCLKLDFDNTERELKGLLAAMDFFKLKKGIILTENSHDVFVQEDKRIEIMPAWEYFE